MANLILTTECQRNCPYCFAQADKNNGQVFSWDNFVKAVGFISTGPKFLNLMGGEPTLHKDFLKMLNYLILKDFKVQVFTNGLISDSLLKEIKILLSGTGLREEQLSFGINVNESKYRTEDELDRQIKTFMAIGNYSYLSFTIHDENTDLFFLRDLINEHGLDPILRLGLAQPVRGGPNKFLDPGHYKRVAQNIIKLSNNSPGITITFDCGFPLCMFTLQEINDLNDNTENDFSFNCGHSIDIYPDLSVTNCYVLSNLFKGRLEDYKDYTALVNFLVTGFMTATGIFDTCKECVFFRRVCSGGCKGFFRPEKNS